MKLTICSSAHFYKQAVEIQDRLRPTGIDVILPETAEIMKKTGDYDVDHYKTWFGNKDDYHKKTELIRKHFVKVAASDAILVLNFEKRDIKNYIGGNVLMEMALAFYLNKPIFILNDIPEESTFLEEIIGLNPIALHGDFKLLKSELNKLVN